MDFTFTEAQQELAALSRRILADRVTPQRLRGLSEDRFDPSLWRELAAAGLLDAAELGLLDHCSMLVEFGRAVAPVPYLSSIVVGASTLLRFGTNDLHGMWAREAMAGELVITAALTAEDTRARGEERRRVDASTAPSPRFRPGITRGCSWYPPRAMSF